jgi:hypothetical protein
MNEKIKSSCYEVHLLKIANEIVLIHSASYLTINLSESNRSRNSFSIFKQDHVTRAMVKGGVAPSRKL